MRSAMAGWLVVLACAALVAYRAATVAAPVAGRVATQAEREALAAEAARLEPGWEQGAQREYPGDRWSEDDDFHAREKIWARAAARRFGVRQGDVLRAVDDGLRSSAAQAVNRAARRLGVVPCKPRPFYD